MNRVGVLALTALVVLAAVGAGTGAVAATSGDTAGQERDIAGVQGGLMQTDDSTNETNTTERTTSTTTSNETTESNESEPSMQAGAKLAGVIGSQQAEHESAVQTRAFDTAFERAATNESQAAVVATSSARIEERIQVLENQSERLKDRFENESLPESAYYARMTVLTARISALETRATQTSTRAKTLPESALEARGINASDIEQLESRARNVTSPHASAIAKRVAGPKVGQPTGPPETVPGHQDERGPPGANNQSANPGNGAQDGPPGQSANQTRGPGNNTDNNPSAGQGPGNSPTNNATAGQGPGTNPATNASGGQGFGNSHATNATVGHGPGDSPANNASGGQGSGNNPPNNGTAGHGPNDAPGKNGTTGNDAIGA